MGRNNHKLIIHNRLTTQKRIIFSYLSIIERLLNYDGGLCHVPINMQHFGIKVLNATHAIIEIGVLTKKKLPLFDHPTLRHIWREYCARTTDR